MNKHYDAGLVGCWYWGNYGSLLNGYAVGRLLRDMGLDVLNIVSPYNGFEPHARKFFEAVYKKEDISDVLPFEQLGIYNSLCDTFVTGSDQIWNYRPNKKNIKYDKYFRLDFADDDKRKISFATSFGKYNKEEEEVRREFARLYGRYNAISVREAEGVEIMKKSYGIDAARVLEPVLDVDRSCWENIAQLSEYKEREQYLLTYILDPTPEKRKAIEFYSKKLGMKTVNILDGFLGAHERNSAKLNLPGTLPNIWCADFLYFFQNAYFVISDSFHGACFSMIFNKPFIAVSNFSRGISRFKTLLEKVQLMDRLVPDTNIPLNEDLLYYFDYSKANEMIRSERERSVNWLKKALNTPVREKVRVKTVKSHINNSLDVSLCMGCGACVSECPVSAVQLKTDKEGVYRSVVDDRRCIDCGRCKNVCAALKLPKNLNTNSPLAYACVAADEKIREESSSGGAFSVLAGSVLRRGGAVCGAAWEKDFTLSHIIIEEEKDLEKLRKSKYFQSFTGNVFKEIKKLLDSGREVLFCGTPCQVTGLKKFLGRSCKNLLLVDVFCANCPGVGGFKKYFDENFDASKVKEYQFRYKKAAETSWNDRKTRILMKDGSSIIRTKEEDDYAKIFHKCSFSLATQCLECCYQGSTRAGDLTLGDCWGIENYDKGVDSYLGVSAVLVNNVKGEAFLAEIPKSEFAYFKEEPFDKIKKYNVLAFIEKRNWKGSEKREFFHREVSRTSYAQAAKRSLETFGNK